MAEVSVIISTYGRDKCLCDTVSYIIREDYPLFELIVIDQLPQHSRQTRRFLTETKDKIRYFSVDFASLPRARNFGVKKAKGEIIIFCDDDIIPKPGFIRRFVEAYKNDNIRGVAGWVLSSNERKHIGISTRKINLIGLKVKGGFLSFRKSAILEVGGYDEEYRGPALREESDLAARIIKKGGTILYGTDISCIHLGEIKGGCHAPIHQREKFIIQNNIRYGVRNLNVLWQLVWVCLVFRWCVLTRRNSRSPFLLAKSIKTYVNSLIHALLFQRRIRQKIDYLNL